LTEISPKKIGRSLIEEESIDSIRRDLFHPKNATKDIKCNEQRQK